MESVKVERLDHHGLVSGIVDELKLVDIIDSRLDADDQSVITTGEAVKAMILNGLGFSNRPLMLTPQFYENLPIEPLFREGLKRRSISIATNWGAHWMHFTTMVVTRAPARSSSVNGSAPASRPAISITLFLLIIYEKTY